MLVMKKLVKRKGRELENRRMEGGGGERNRGNHQLQMLMDRNLFNQK
jgi:hypothetical protein